MPLMMGDLYTALVAAGASEDKAMAAAIEVATYCRPARLNTTTQTVVWMVGGLLVLTFAILLKVYL